MRRAEQGRHRAQARATLIWANDIDSRNQGLIASNLSGTGVGLAASSSDALATSTSEPLVGLRAPVVRLASLPSCDAKRSHADLASSPRAAKLATCRPAGAPGGADRLVSAADGVRCASCVNPVPRQSPCTLPCRFRAVMLAIKVPAARHDMCVLAKKKCPMAW